MKNKKMLCAILIIVSLAAAVLNATPNAVLMRFGTENGTIYKYVSGFSMLPVGYGIWGAMVAGICSVILTVLGIIGLMKESTALRKWMLGISVLALLMRLSLLFFGSMTFIGILISVLLAAETVLISYNRNTD